MATLDRDFLNGVYTPFEVKESVCTSVQKEQQEQSSKDKSKAQKKALAEQQGQPSDVSKAQVSKAQVKGNLIRKGRLMERPQKSQRERCL